MSILKHFRKRRPVVQVEKISREDMVTAHVWGLSLTDWLGLTEFERRECRRNITAAPGFVP